MIFAISSLGSSRCGKRRLVTSDQGYWRAVNSRCRLGEVDLPAMVLRDLGSGNVVNERPAPEGTRVAVTAMRSVQHTGFAVAGTHVEACEAISVRFITMHARRQRLCRLAAHRHRAAAVLTLDKSQCTFGRTRESAFLSIGNAEERGELAQRTCFERLV